MSVGISAITSAERKALWSAIDSMRYQVWAMREVPSITQDQIDHERKKLALARRAYLKLNKAMKAEKAKKETT